MACAVNVIENSLFKELQGYIISFWVAQRTAWGV
jgi:hypothetical protein